jgi:hypothetical protein
MRSGTRELQQGGDPRTGCENDRVVLYGFTVAEPQFDFAARDDSNCLNRAVDADINVHPETHPGQFKQYAPGGYVDLGDLRAPMGAGCGAKHAVKIMGSKHMMR